MPENRITQSYGLWDSPLSPARLSGGTAFGDVAWDGSGALAWLEKRADRNALVIQMPGPDAPRDLNEGHSARGGVGYGGGAFTIGRGQAYFVEAETGRLFRQDLSGGLPQPITPAFGAAAAPALSPDGRWLLYVHSDAGVDSLAIAETQGARWPARLVGGDDFYMQPCWHPSGERLAWIAWNHPQMPWDGTFLYTASLKLLPGALPQVAEIAPAAGLDRPAAIQQPRFSPDGRYLAYVADEEAFWQIYLLELSTGQVRRLTHDDWEYGQPPWVQGLRTYDFNPDGRSIYAVRTKNGIASLVQVDLVSGQVAEAALAPAYTWLEQPAVSPDGAQVALIAAGSQVPPRLITLQPGIGERVRARSAAEDLPPVLYRVPEHLSWEAGDGSAAHGLLYLPANPAYKGEGPPPLIVSVHSGPTGQAVANFEPRYAFFTSRGYAVLAVNYRGSAGYGRLYRQALNGNWGVLEVEDVVSGARYLQGEGLVDPERLVIEGGSAGGFTVLLALIHHPGLFKAGICRYPVVDLLSMAESSFKFEAHYLDSLIGPMPRYAQVYRERSPLARADEIRDPLLLFHGEADPVVPVLQSEALVSVLRSRGIPHEFHLFPGEGHGFRKPESVRAYYEFTDRFLKTHLVYGQGAR